MSATEDTKGFKEGKIVGGRWRVIKKLGEGGMGAVYKVEDKKRKNYFAAMKVEEDLTEGGVLKLEVHVLTQLKGGKSCVTLLDSGKRDKYCFMVMTMCGEDLMMLKRMAGKPFSEATTLRLAISALYSIKELHEIGYVHRDIKPGNCMIGKHGRDARTVYLIDMGMVRAFTAKDEATGKIAIRKPRDGDQLFRGTPRYCSLNTHNRKEQGRVDDLWSWLYMLIELHVGLPWNRMQEEREIKESKENTTVEQLTKNCPVEFIRIHEYLKTLKYEDRPDYFGLYSECFAGLKRVHGSFLDKYEWEKNSPADINTALSISAKTSSTKKPATRLQMAKKMYPMASATYFKENVLGL